MKLATKPTATSAFTSLEFDYVRANQWATETIVTWLKSKPSDLIEKELPSSFPGIRGTLGHHVGFHDAPMTDFSFYLFRIKQ